jgi:hypothetical protein
LFFNLFVQKEIVRRNQYYPNNLFTEKLDQADFGKYLVWRENNLHREINGVILERIESGRSSWKLPR